MKRVSVIVPCHNRLELTKQTIKSLFENTNPDLYDAYIIDDVSNDGTREWLASNEPLEWAAKNGVYAVVKINEKNVGPAASRNEMCDLITKNNMRHEFVYHSDNDVFFKPRWLEDLILIFERVETQGVKLLGGSCHPYLQDNAKIYPPNYPFYVGLKDAVSGYSQLMRWEIWDKYGPFSDANRNEDVKIMGSEDWLFCQNMIKDGLKVGSIYPEVVVPCGKTNTYGKPATGAETFKNVDGVKVI